MQARQRRLMNCNGACPQDSGCCVHHVLRYDKFHALSEEVTPSMLKSGAKRDNDLLSRKGPGADFTLKFGSFADRNDA